MVLIAVPLCTAADDAGGMLLLLLRGKAEGGGGMCLSCLHCVLCGQLKIAAAPAVRLASSFSAAWGELGGVC